MAADVELIAYADRLGGGSPGPRGLPGLRGLREVLDGPLAGLFGGVHVLPFFRPYDGADAGFDPDDHTEVDPRLGDWSDVARLAADHALMVDVIVNHVSSRSRPFRNWLAEGERSPYAGMFLTLDGVFAHGATERALLDIYRPRPGLPFTPYRFDDGTARLVWTTFTAQQIDLDVRHPATVSHLAEVLDRLAAAGVRRVRLDAVGYAVKTPGTSCFMTPQTFAFIDDLTGWCRSRGLEVLVEVHSYYRRQIEIAARVDRVYDFALPPLVLHALTAGDADPLLDWMGVRPVNAVTVLDTHDGIGVIDVGAAGDQPGLLTPEHIDRLVEAIHDNSGGTSRRATGAAASNVDLYQVNCTFYDALGRDDDRYLLARAIQFFTPGVPQVYYVGLLAGCNDVELLERTGVGRDVNRRYYTRAEVDDQVRRPVVRALLRLIRFRNSHPAFDGTCEVTGGGSRLTMTWTHDDHRVVLGADVATAAASVTWTAGEQIRTASVDALPG